MFVLIDERVLISDYGHLLRRLCLKTNKSITVLTSYASPNLRDLFKEMDFTKTTIILCGLRVNLLKEISRFQKIILLAPSRLLTKTTFEKWPKNKSLTVFVSEYETDGRSSWWLNRLKDRRFQRVKVETIEGAALPLNWAWEDVIDKLEML